VASYINLPTLSSMFMYPQRMAFRVEGYGIDGGRNGDGDSAAIDFSGGGRIVGSYEECVIQQPAQHNYINWLAALLDGSTRCINVPIIADWIGPFPLDAQGNPQSIIGGISHSDGTFFNDDTGYSQSTVGATFESAAAQNAGQITVNIFGGVELLFSTWMSTYHATRGWRAWRYFEKTAPVIVTRTFNGFPQQARQYVLSITPPLREAVVAGQQIELTRPKFVGRFPRGFSLDWSSEGWWQARPTIQFVEAEVR
jgi:hypothetical protein